MSTAQKHTPREYTVTMTFQYPAWDEKDGIQFDVIATSKSEAIKKARAMAERDGHTGGGRGRYSFRAALVGSPSLGRQP